MDKLQAMKRSKWSRGEKGLGREKRGCDGRRVEDNGFEGGSGGRGFRYSYGRVHES